ncbi:MAG: P-loop NTPase fold protein [Alphaproteobacteria bacterium]|jgi:hypothetical protein|nr:P-loop NTPase fold protein [Alphaproteobacteria bacterium]
MKEPMHIKDEPITSSENDLLNYKRYLKPLKKAILKYSEAGGGFLQIDGKWGIGKSSVKKLFIDDIENKKISKNYNILDIDASKYGNSKELNLGILKKIIYKNKKSSYIFTLNLIYLFTLSILIKIFLFPSSAYKTTCNFLNIIFNGQLCFNSIYFNIIYITSLIILIYFTSIKSFKLTTLTALYYNSKSPYKIFEGFIKISPSDLIDETKKNIIFIDDVDRITNHKYLMDLFKVCRENFNKNFIIIYLFDTQKMTELLSYKENEKYSQDFFEKYINYKLYIKMEHKDKYNLITTLVKNNNLNLTKRGS